MDFCGGDVDRQIEDTVCTRIPPPRERLDIRKSGLEGSAIDRRKALDLIQVALEIRKKSPHVSDNAEDPEMVNLVRPDHSDFPVKNQVRVNNDAFPAKNASVAAMIASFHGYSKAVKTPGNPSSIFLNSLSDQERETRRETIRQSCLLSSKNNKKFLKKKNIILDI